MLAYSLIRDFPWYRRSAFAQGLRAAGYDVVHGHPAKLDRDTLLVIWNRYGFTHDLALRVEKAGGRVIVAENGYLGKYGVSPKFDVHPNGPKPDSYYALSLDYHNGGGRWPATVDGVARWQALGVQVKPWRTQGEHVLVCPNRSFGPPERAMRADWADKTALQISKQTKRPVRIRRHPGNLEPKNTPLSADFANAWAVVIWSSTVGVHALAEGIPVYVDAPFWVMKGASASGHIDNPVLPERLIHLQRMACQQWTLEEIASGEPFRRLLEL